MAKLKVACEILFTKLLPCICPGEYVALAGARLDGAEMLACGLATHFVRSNVGSLVTYIFNYCTTKHTFLYTATKNRTLKLSGTCYTNPDIINVVYVLYQSITPSK